VKFPFIGLTVFFMVLAPIATQATDFQIDKIVKEGLAKAQAEQSVLPTPDVVTKPQPTPQSSALKTQKTDPQDDPSEEN
jgi:hypothetical protein